MLRFEWNALRPGDHVAMHDDGGSLALCDATVVLVQTANGNNDIAVHVAGAAQAVTRPRRMAVHLLPLDPGEQCWRCDAVAAQ